MTIDQGLAAIVVAVITTVGVVIAALIQAARKENHRDHAAVGVALLRLRSAIDRATVSIEKVDTKLDRHLLDHERGTHDGTTWRDQV